jgi:hypothetical protein
MKTSSEVNARIRRAASSYAASTSRRSRVVLRVDVVGRGHVVCAPSVTRLDQLVSWTDHNISNAPARMIISGDLLGQPSELDG